MQTAVVGVTPSSARQNTPFMRARVPAGSVAVVGVPVSRLDCDDAGEPRVVEGTAAIVGRDTLMLETVRA